MKAGFIIFICWNYNLIWNNNSNLLKPHSEIYQSLLNLILKMTQRIIISPLSVERIMPNLFLSIYKFNLHTYSLWCCCVQNIQHISHSKVSLWILLLYCRAQSNLSNTYLVSILSYFDMLYYVTSMMFCMFFVCLWQTNQLLEHLYYILL